MALPIPLAASVSFAPLVKCFWTTLSVLLLHTYDYLPDCVVNQASQNSQFRQVFKQVCVDDELADAEIVDAEAAAQGDFSRFVNLYRYCSRNVGDCPRMADLRRFPYSEEYADRMYSIASLHKAYAEKMASLTPFGEDSRDAWQFLASESVDLLCVWSNYCTAVHNRNSISYRRECLRSLKQSIGERNFELGVMPDACPFKMPPN